MSQILALSASLCFIVVVVTYLGQVVTGDSVPNPATWFIWAVAISLNAATYVLVLQGDWLKSSISIIAAIGITTIFIYSLIRGKFAPLGKIEVFVLFLCVGIGVFWRVSENASLSNLALQIILAISFAPTIKGLLEGSLREKQLPWVIATFSYILQILSIFADWENQTWVAVAFPVVNGIIGNGSVLVIITLQSRGLLKPQT